MGTLLSLMRRSAIDVIPDRETMIDIVDAIALFEEKLKRGDQLTKAEQTEKAKVDRVAREMKALQRFHADKTSVRPLRGPVRPVSSES